MQTNERSRDICGAIHRQRRIRGAYKVNRRPPSGSPPPSARNDTSSEVPQPETKTGTTVETRREAIKRRMLDMGYTEREYNHVRHLPDVANETPLTDEEWLKAKAAVVFRIARLRLHGTSALEHMEKLYKDIELSR
ncbi:hypothetical protein PM082_014696 [Marasmius tenuissimus]|nr:hypothetical protein PM082_014696 [Marasmius tenuissimus]